MIHFLVHYEKPLAIASVLSEAGLPISISCATNRAELEREIPNADVLVTVGRDLDDDILDAATNLKWIQGLISGTDKLEPLLANRPDILLTSARGLHGPAVSEIALLMMLALARNFPTFLRQQDRGFWGGPMIGQNSGTLLDGKTVGIAGIGIIGEAIAHRCKAMGMRTIGYVTEPRDCAGIDQILRYSELEESVGELDFLVSVAPLTDKTRSMFNARIFAAMRPTAYFVNVGRGDTVVEEALIEALQGKQIAGAALDTFSQEPLAPDSPLWRSENLLITPHVSGSYDCYMSDAAKLVAVNATLFIEGNAGEMINLLTPERTSIPSS